MSTPAPPLRRFLYALAVLLLLFAYGYRLGSPPLFDDPNDGQYAEVPREMVETGNWLSPQLDYVLFLNKPPLLYWLIATVYTAGDVNEAAARIPGAVATLVTVALIYFLGRELFDGTTGALAALLYGAFAGSLVEARFIRPDALLISGLVGAVLGFVMAVNRDGAARRRALYGMQVGLAVALMAKGMVGLVLSAVPIATIIVTERRWDALRMLVAPRGWILFLALVAPWHVAMAMRHPGFAWDYIVNQHVLFFLDRKEPRTSTPISLGWFWIAFLLRTFPWTLLLPAVVLWSAGRVNEPGHGRSYRALLAWAAAVLLFFSAASSRLEHYCQPAAPAVALLVAALLRHGASKPGPWRNVVVAHFALLAVVFAAAFLLAPRSIDTVEWLRGRSDLPRIAHVFFAVLASAALAAAFGARRASLPSAALLAAALLALMPAIHAGMSTLTPINSWKPVADLLRSTPDFEDATIVCEAPMEYQLCAGLGFYLRRRIELLRPPGFVDPPYLAPHSLELFIDGDELNRRWRDGHVLFVSDALRPMTRSPREIVPVPLYIVARTSNRWILSNRPVH
jgi:4-amino-4-deoxy-L-arabinose transferase-like glycosyltransferase